MLRTDRLDEHLGGNKWFKLKYNLNECLRQGHDTLLTFGGAWSNHIHATAAAADALGLRSLGIIRGEAVRNPNLDFARRMGMQLTFIDRASYRHRHDTEMIDALHERFGDFYAIPEGGSNALALHGVAEMLSGLDASADHIVCACGTGSTLAGLVIAAPESSIVTGIPVLHAHGTIETLITEGVGETQTQWRLQTGYEFGGYAKLDAALMDFMAGFHERFGITLDAVYTAKMFYGLFDMIRDGRFEKDSKVLAVHTGGLQGNVGFGDRLASHRPDTQSRGYRLTI